MCPNWRVSKATWPPTVVRRKMNDLHRAAGSLQQTLLRWYAHERGGCDLSTTGIHRLTLPFALKIAVSSIEHLRAAYEPVATNVES